MKQVIILSYLLSILLAGSAATSAAEIHDAARKGDQERVEALLKQDPKLLNTCNDRIATPLHFACDGGHADLAGLLLERGAELQARDVDGDTPLHWAAFAGKIGPAKLLLVARETGNAAMAKALLEQGAEIDAVGPAGEKLLVYATERKLDRMFSLLTEKGVNLDIRDRNGDSLLHAAAEGGSPEIARILIEKRKPLNETDRYGWTPLHYAAKRGRTAVARPLLDEGAKPDLRTTGGCTPLNVAQKWGHAELIELLRSRGVSEAPVRFPLLEGAYFGQQPPGPEPKLFAVDVVSTNGFEHGCITFTPDGKQAYWSTSYLIRDAGYADGAVFSSRQENGRCPSVMRRATISAAAPPSSPRTRAT